MYFVFIFFIIFLFLIVKTIVIWNKVCIVEIWYYTFIFGLNKANMNLTGIYKKRFDRGNNFKISNILDQNWENSKQEKKKLRIT